MKFKYLTLLFATTAMAACSLNSDKDGINHLKNAEIIKNDYLQKQNLIQNQTEKLKKYKHDNLHNSRIAFPHEMAKALSKDHSDFVANVMNNTDLDTCARLNYDDDNNTAHLSIGKYEKEGDHQIFKEHVGIDYVTFSGEFGGCSTDHILSMKIDGDVQKNPEGSFEKLSSEYSTKSIQKRLDRFDEPKVSENIKISMKQGMNF